MSRRRRSARRSSRTAARGAAPAAGSEPFLRSPVRGRRGPSCSCRRCRPLVDGAVVPPVVAVARRAGARRAGVGVPLSVVPELFECRCCSSSIRARVPVGVALSALPMSLSDGTAERGRGRRGPLRVTSPPPQPATTSATRATRRARGCARGAHAASGSARAARPCGGRSRAVVEVLLQSWSHQLQKRRFSTGSPLASRGRWRRSGTGAFVDPQMP